MTGEVGLLEVVDRILIFVGDDDIDDDELVRGWIVAGLEPAAGVAIGRAVWDDNEREREAGQKGQQSAT